MTQYGGPIVQWFGRCKNWRATGAACSVSGRDDFGQPGKSAAGGEGAARRDDLASPARCRSFSPAPTAATGRRRLHRWVFGPGWKAPSDIRLQLRDDGLILNDNGGRSIHFEPLLPGEAVYSRSESIGWCAVVRQHSRRPGWRGCGGALPDIRLPASFYWRPTAHRAVVDTGVV